MQKQKPGKLFKTIGAVGEGEMGKGGQFYGNRWKLDFWW